MTIQLDKVTKTYQVGKSRLTALQTTSVTFADGEITGIIGQSGAGKSTLLHLINGLEQPSSGEVWVQGQALSKLSRQDLRNLRRKIGMIFQSFNLVSAKSVFDNVALPLRLEGMSGAGLALRVNALLERVGLLDLAKAYPAQLSGGQKQRVAIARALTNRPSILLSDEATSALDPQTTQSILALLKSLQKDLGFTMVLITHEMSVIKTLASEVLVMQAGQIVEKGRLLEIFTNPQQPFTRQLVAESMGSQLPEALANRLSSPGQVASGAGLPLLHCVFRDTAATQPLIAGVVQDCQVSVNILQAHVETLQGVLCGTMIFSLSDPEKLAAVKAYLTTRGVLVEVLGYVAFS